MQTIIDYLKTTYSARQLAFLAVLGGLLAIGLIISLSLAVISTCKKIRRKKLYLETEISETYLLYAHLCDELIEFTERGEEKSPELEKLTAEIDDCEQKLKDLLRGKDLSAAKTIAERNLERQKNIIKKADVQIEEQNRIKLDYETPEANFLDDDAIEEVKTIFADADKPFTEEVAQAEENRPEPLPKWIITTDDGSYSAELIIGENKVLTSSVYKSLSGVKSAITTIKNNVLNGNAVVTMEEKKFLIKVFSASGRVIAVGEKFDLSTDANEAKSLCEEYIEKAPFTISDDDI